MIHLRSGQFLMFLEMYIYLHMYLPNWIVSTPFMGVEEELSARSSRPEGVRELQEDLGIYGHAKIRYSNFFPQLIISKIQKTITSLDLAERTRKETNSIRNELTGNAGWNSISSLWRTPRLTETITCLDLQVEPSSVFTVTPLFEQVMSLTT